MLKKFSIALACSTLLSMMAFSFDVTSSHAAEGRERQIDKSCQSPKVFFNGDIDFSLSKASNVKKFYDSDVEQVFYPRPYSEDVEIDISSSLSMRFENYLQNGSIYGGNIKVLLSNGGDSLGLDNIARSGVSVFLKSPYFGLIELGTVKGASEKMMIDASSIAAGDGGIGSTSWFNYVNVEGSYSYEFIPSVIETNAQGDVINSIDESENYFSELHPFYLLPKLYIGYSQTPGLFDLNSYRGTVNAENISNKISYFSNEFSGITLGVSYAPHSTHVKKSSLKNYHRSLSKLLSTLQNQQAANISGNINTMLLSIIDTQSLVYNYKNMFSAGIKFNKDFEDDLNLEISAVAERAEFDSVSGNAFTSGLNDIFGWNLGGKLEYAGFSLAGSYGSTDISGIPKTLSTVVSSGGKLEIKGVDTDPGQTNFWTLGAAYSLGQTRLSVGYFHSVTSPIDKECENSLQHISVSADYNIANLVHSHKESSSRFGPYVSWHLFDTKEHPVYSEKALESDENNSGYLIVAGMKYEF